MATSTKCQTPGAQFHTHITGEKASVTIDFGKKIPLNEEEATLLEANLHNAVEQVMAKYYASSGKQTS